MWLLNSSVGRKFVMALTGACLVLFVTFHCLMNSVALIWPEAYNSICEFLGANWYALIASAGLAVLVIIHIFYAVWLTVQNRNARGSIRYSIEKRPASVEWSSKNMLVLGIVILAFLVVHLIQFWAKMQLQEIRGVDDVLPPAAGTLFLQVAFECPWTIIVYIIGFIALWFHMNHGFWSMFQTVGWDSTAWIPRLKKIGCWWTSIVILLFIAQAILFTVQANNKFFLRNERLRDQYKEMLVPMYEKDFGPDAAQAITAMPYKTFSFQLRQMNEQFSNEQFKAMQANNPEFAKQSELVGRTVALLDLLEEGQSEEENNPMFMGQPQH